MIIFYNMTIRYFSSYHSMWFLLMFWCQYPLQCSSMCVYLLFPSSAFTPPTCVACFATSVRLARSLRAVVMFPAGEGFADRWHIPEGRWWGDSGPLRSGFSKVDLSALLCHRNTFIVVVVVVVGSTRAPWLSIPALSFCCLSGFFHPLLTQEHVCETFALAQPARHLLNSFKMRLDMFMRLCVSYCVRVLQAFLAWGISLKGETCSSIFISCVKLDKRSVFFTSVRTERDVVAQLFESVTVQRCRTTIGCRSSDSWCLLFLQTAASGLLCLLHVLHQQLLAFSLFT